MGKKEDCDIGKAVSPEASTGRSAFTALVASVLGAAVQAAFAQQLPAGGQVAAGTAVITQTGERSLQVTQGTPSAILNWQSFSIGAGNSVVFQQPSASAIALNRVIGNSPTEIFGSLTANGQLFLVNPSGVLFGRGASVDVGGLAASTLGIKDSDFLAGRYSFTNGGGAGKVVNDANITTLSGYAALIGPQVLNNGIINARMGTAALGAGDQVTLDMVGNGLINLRVERDALNASAINTGTITADGGNVLMTARSANALLDTVLSSEGVIRANALAERGGTIYLDGGPRGVTSVSGKLEASGLGQGQKGGSIAVLGDKVGLLGNASVNVSGSAGGGTVLVGGDFQGANPAVRNSARTYVGQDVSITADAVNSGNGGKVILWADDVTSFYGNISARGGAQSGDGGFVETSGKAILKAVGNVDAAAPNGNAGNWLLDPNNITIQTAGSDTNVTASPNFASTNDSAIVTTGSIQTALNAGTSVTVTTASAGTSAQLGDITVANAIAKTAGGTATLTLNAANNIDFIAGADVSSTTGALGLTLNATGAISSLRNVSLNGGVLTLNATGNGTQSGTIQASTSVVKSGTGNFTLSGVNTYTGGTTIKAGALIVTTSASALGTGTVTLGDAAGGSNAASLLIGTNGLNYANAIALAPTTTGALTLGNTGTAISTTFSGGVSGANNLTINSNATTGTITLSGGGVNNAGTVTNVGAGSGTTTISGGVGSNVTGVVQNSTTSALTVSGALTVNAGGTTLTNTAGTKLLTVSGGVTGTGALVLNNNSATAGGITVSGTTVNHTGTVTNSGTGSGGSTISAVVGTNVTGVVQNSASSALNFTTAANTYTSGLTIKAGTVTGSVANSFGANANVITLGDSTGSANATLSGAGAVTYANAITVASGNTGVATITDSAASTFSGAVTLNTHDLVLSPAAGALTLSGGVTGTGNVTLNSSRA